MLRILFFDDFPYESENRLLRLRLRRKLRGFDVQVVEERTVHGFEDRVQRNTYEIVVLDIMARAPSGLTSTDTGRTVPDALTGVELLRRCRKGDYGEHYKFAPVYMRTARGEPQIRLLCEREGATAFFRAGGEDTQLIEKIAEDVETLTRS